MVFFNNHEMNTSKQQMQNRITALFERKHKNILSVFFTAGFPALDDTRKIIISLERSGVDMIEIGIPFSDPLADGPVIQASSEKALQNGMSLDILFKQLADIRREVKLPLVLMGYLNPVMQYGISNFVSACNSAGIDGVILPDLPPDVYEMEYKTLFEENNLANILLITPHSAPERVKEIDRISGGFVYLVSSSSTTGGTLQFDETRYQQIKEMQLQNPVLIGFGISNPQTFAMAGNYANGAIIGSAFIKAIAHGNLEQNIEAFMLPFNINHSNHTHEK